jgi:hypothetical protein
MPICCLGLLAAQWICGQTPTEPEVKGRRAWVVATTIPEDVPNPLPVMAGERLHEVRMHLRSVGQAIPIDESGVVRAVKPITGEDGEITYQELSRSRVPEGVREALIVLVPDTRGSDGTGFRSKVIDLSKFKKGGCLYVNLVKTKIGITIDEQKTVVKPGGMEFINPLAREDQGVFTVGFFYEVFDQPDAEWKLMTSSKMAIYRSRREICIFYYNEEIDNVDFRGIPFMTPPPRR